MKPSRILIFSLLFVSIFVRAQGHNRVQTNNGSITIELSTYDQQDSRGFLILYPISEIEDNIKDQLKYPDLSKVRDTAYAEIYFTGNNENALANTVMTLIGNYTSDSPEIWIDYDNDLNFTETDKPCIFNNDSIEVSIPDTRTRTLQHSVRFYKLDSALYKTTNSRLSKYITKGKHVAFYFDQRLNIQVGDFINNGDSIRIGVMDYDVNGAYNDLNKDRIVIGDYRGQIHGTDKASGATVLDENNYFNHKSKVYEIQKIEADGSSVTLSQVENKYVADRVGVGDTIADYTFELVNGKEASVKTLLDGENYLYLNFWASWCAGCHHEMQSLEKVATSDSIKVVSLNYNEGQEVIDQFIEEYHPSWMQGRSTEKINLKLMIEGLPRNILIDPSGKIINMDIHPIKLLKGETVK